MDIIIGQGTVRERGEDLKSGRNIADYLDKKGRMDLLTFFQHHKNEFPVLFVIVQREMSRRVVEVPCETFFGIAGYVAAPRRSQLNVRNYERVSMLSVMLRCIYIDPVLVAEEYLRRCKKGAWKPGSTAAALKCFNLERILDAEAMGEDAPELMTLADYLAGANGATTSAAKAKSKAGPVVEIDSEDSDSESSFSVASDV